MNSRTNRRPGSGSALSAAAIVFGALIIFALAASCTARNADSGGIDKPNPKLRSVELSSGTVTVRAEVAATELERNRGLMYRTSLKDGEGMLFVFDKDQKVAFWMKNTSLPLSIAYIGSDGVVYQILDLVPFSEEPRPSDRSIRYALEVPQGWFSRVGIKAGDRFGIPRL